MAVHFPTGDPTILNVGEDRPDLYLVHYDPSCHAPPTYAKTPRTLTLKFERTLTESLNRTRKNIFRSSVPPCPTPWMSQVVDQNTGEILRESPRLILIRGVLVEDRCRRNSCPACAIAKARRIAGAIELAVPSHQFCVTMVGATCKEINDNMRRVMNIMRKTDRSLRYVWAAEPNPNRNGAHAHGYLHCESAVIPRSLLQDACQRVGVGPHFKLEKVPTNSQAAYFAYPFKSLVIPDDREDFLNLNGSGGESQQLVHASRTGFWRDGVGGRLLTRDKAQQLSYQRWLESH